MAQLRSLRVQPLPSLLTVALLGRLHPEVTLLLQSNFSTKFDSFVEQQHHLVATEWKSLQLLSTNITLKKTTFKFVYFLIFRHLHVFFLLQKRGRPPQCLVEVEASPMTCMDSVALR